MPETAAAETIRRPLMSGHCNTENSTLGQSSHDRCERNGGGQRANPQREFQPCPCPGHYPGEVYECGGCGREIKEAPLWPLDEDGDVRYTHIDGTGRATGEDCTQAPPKGATVQVEYVDEVADFPDAEVSGNPEPEPVVYMPVEYDEYDRLLAEFDMDEDD